MKFLHEMWLLDQKDPSKKLSPEQVLHDLVSMPVCRQDWYEQITLSALRVKEFYGPGTANHKKAIDAVENWTKSYCEFGGTGQN
jgi:hypothetical protein